MGEHYGKDADAAADDHDSVPAQVTNDAPDKPAPDDAGEGAENSANPVQDEARPDNLNTAGW
jgi:hypothetical protein